MRTNPRPKPEAIGFYYPDDYGPYQGNRIDRTKGRRPSAIKTLIKRIIAGAFKFHSAILPPLIPGRLLEVGCASGAFLHEMACQGWQVQGIEPSKKAARVAAELGYHVHVGTLNTASEPNHSFDLIVGWMVLEHLHDPIESLQKLREWAKPDAWLVLSIPNSAALEFRFFKQHWYALQLPNHLYHFTPQTVERVLHSGGWKIEKVYHQRILSNLVASMGYVLRGKGYARLGKRFIEFPKKAGVWPYVLYPIACVLSIFGQTGRMTIWAKPK
jgi:2-polyprenyl-3-methyl-5-hydroxy-6-metoxy-1,4-benzoquinol methylase